MKSCCSFHSRHRSRFEAHRLRRNLASSAAVNGRSSLGTIHGGVRWNTVTCAATFASSGTTWTALAPVPITATRLPVRSTPASQRDVCITGPAKAERPAMSGSLGSPNNPTALTTTSAAKPKPLPLETDSRSRLHCWIFGFQRMLRTRVPVSRCRFRSNSSATDSR